MNTTKRITLLYTSFLLMLCTPLFSQITGTGIGTQTPNPSAVLDVVNEGAGILIPRMTTVQKNAIQAPAPGLLVYDTTVKCISQNSGSATTPNWVCLSLKNKHQNFLYMPALEIDASAVGTVTLPLDLYNIYKTKFSTPIIRSVYSPISIPYFPNATDLYYYISYYDDELIRISEITAEGKMSYEILKTAPSGSFMNVVFVVK